MKKLIWRTGAVTLCALLLTCHIGIAEDQEKKVIRVSGAGVASDQVNDCAQKFMASHPGVSVVVTGTSAGKGFETLLDRQAEIAIMSRQVLPEEEKASREKGILLQSKNIGLAGVAVMTHPRNPLNELSLEQIGQMFSGGCKRWKEVGGPDEVVRPVSRRVPESGAAVFFQNTVMKGSAFGNNAALALTWQTVIKLCADDKTLSLGIAPPTRALADKTVKVIAVKRDQSSSAILPTPEHISDGTYPIVLPVSLMWRSQDESPELLNFVDFCSIKYTPMP